MRATQTILQTQQQAACKLLALASEALAVATNTDLEQYYKLCPTEFRTACNNVIGWAKMGCISIMNSRKIF